MPVSQLTVNIQSVNLPSHPFSLPPVSIVSQSPSQPVIQASQSSSQSPVSQNSYSSTQPASSLHSQSVIQARFPIELFLPVNLQSVSHSVNLASHPLSHPPVSIVSQSVIQSANLASQPLRILNQPVSKSPVLSQLQSASLPPISRHIIRKGTSHSNSPQLEPYRLYLHRDFNCLSVYLSLSSRPSVCLLLSVCLIRELTF